MFVSISFCSSIQPLMVYIFFICFDFAMKWTVLMQVIDTLLDTTKTPRKPQYLLASEIPLVLRTCEFENVDFICSPGNKSDRNILAVVFRFRRYDNNKLLFLA